MAGLISYAASTPDKPALIFGDSGFVETYGELELRSRRIALALTAAGVKPGDCIAILMSNHPAFFDVYWATQRIGAYLAPLNWHSDLNELGYVISNSDARALIAEERMAEKAEQLRSSAEPALNLFFSIGGAISGYASLDQQAATAGAEDTPLLEQAGSVMIYSSGTTGRPKGVRRPLPTTTIDNQAYVDASTSVMRVFGFQADDTYLCPAPLYHAAPIRSCAAMHQLGATVIVMEKFDAEAVLSIIDQHRVSVAQFVPTHFQRMLSLPDEVRSKFDGSSLRVAVHAAAPCPAHVKRAMIEWWGPVLLEYYAGTEGGGVRIDSKQWLEKPGSVGKTWAGLSVAIQSPTGEMTDAPDLEGPIYFRNDAGGAPNFAYYKDDEKTKDAYCGDWFTLGDIGYLDNEGFLFLTDRASNLIISGGVNIYPQEIEDALSAHPKVHDVAIIGTPDPDFGEAVTAVVVPTPGEAPGPALEAELIDYAKAKFASFKCPRSVQFTDDLPRTETGKLLKRKLKDVYG